MIGQAYSKDQRKYNVIILAGGAGSRMGNASEFIPKPLTPLGGRRAIDFIIDRFSLVAGRYIIGTGYHADLLESYVRGRYPHLPIEFVKECPEDMKCDGLSVIHCLDHADSRMGTIVAYCDLVVTGNPLIIPDSILLASPETKGHVGTFRNLALCHNDVITTLVHRNPPVHVPDDGSFGIMGQFVFSSTPDVKAIAYSVYDRVTDLTTDIALQYMYDNPMVGIMCSGALEFGTEEDLAIARKLWENC